LAGSHWPSLELVLGIGFASCGVLLIYALVHTLDAADAGAAADSERPLTIMATHLRAFAALVVLPLFVAFLALALQDYQQTYYGGFLLTRWLNIVSASLILVQFLCGVGMWLWKPTWPTSHAGETRLIAWFSYAMLGLVVATVLGFAALSGVLDVCDTLPPVAMVVCLAIFSIAGIACAYVFARAPLQTLP
jgi:hypothetical protein